MTNRQRASDLIDKAISQHAHMVSWRAMHGDEHPITVKYHMNCMTAREELLAMMPEQAPAAPPEPSRETNAYKLTDAYRQACEDVVTFSDPKWRKIRDALREEIEARMMGHGSDAGRGA